MNTTNKVKIGGNGRESSVELGHILDSGIRGGVSEMSIELKLKGQGVVGQYCRQRARHMQIPKERESLKHKEGGCGWNTEC